MRKLIWCCSTAGVLAAASFLSIGSYAYLHPESSVGHALVTVARASVAMQPLTGLASLALRATRSESPTCATAGSAEECVPADPQPVAVEQGEKIAEADDLVVPGEAGVDAAPIVINEIEAMPAEDVVQAVPATIDMNGVQGQNMPPNGCPIFMPYCQVETLHDGTSLTNGCPIFMPYCQDDEQQATPPAMPYADGDEAKPAKQDEPKADETGEESEQNVFKAWKKIFESGQENKANAVEELPPPTEEPSEAEPKCEEDPHRHEHYSGCPHTTCPYTGKSYPSYEPLRKSGREESSEEPVEKAKPHGTKPHSGDTGKSNEQCPRTQGVDTMEYRSSDGGLNEYGPNPLH
jgi:hypothetical protein